MRKMLKWLVGTTLSLMVIFFVAAIVVSRFVDLNDYKEKLNEGLSKHADAKINIMGEISWQTYPLLSIKLTDVEIKDNKQRYEAKVASTNLSVQWIPLLSKQIKITKLNLDEADVRINANKLGKVAKNSIQPSLQAKVILASAKANDEADSTPAKKMNFDINQLSIRNSNITFIENNKENLKLTDFQLKSEKLSSRDEFFAAKMTTNINHPMLKENQARLDTKIEIHPTQQKANFEGCSVNVKSLSTPCNGTIEWPNKKVKAQFAVDVKVNNLQEIFPDAAKKKLTVSGDMIYQNNQMQIAGMQCQYDDVSIKGDAVYDLKSKQLKLNPVGIDHIGIHHHGQASVVLDKSSKWGANTKAGKINVANVMKYFNKSASITGTGHYTANVNAAGKNKATVTKTITGPLNAEVYGGRIYGVDISGMLKETAIKLEKMLEMAKQQSPENMLLGFVTKSVGDIAPNVGKKRYSSFTELIIRGKFSGGHYHISKMTLTGSDYQIVGSGKINLANESINAQARTSWLGQSKDPTVTQMMKQGLVINISGPLSNPKVTPNTETFMQAAMAEMQKRFIKKVTEKIIDRAINKGLQQGGGSLEPEDVVKDLFGVGGGKKNNPPPNPLDQFFR